MSAKLEGYLWVPEIVAGECDHCCNRVDAKDPPFRDEDKLCGVGGTNCPIDDARILIRDTPEAIAEYAKIRMGIK